MLETGSVLLTLFLEAVKSPFKGAKWPIPGGILRGKSLLPAPCSSQQLSAMECLIPLLCAHLNSPVQLLGFLVFTHEQQADLESGQGLCWSHAWDSWY